jgi:hypothetical protein
MFLKHFTNRRPQGLAFHVGLFGHSSAIRKHPVYAQGVPFKLQNYIGLVPTHKEGDYFLTFLPPFCLHYC